MVDTIQNSFQERLSSFSNIFSQEDNSGGTVQLNLNLTEHACSKGTTRHDTTRHVFHFTRMKACVCTQD